MAGYNRGPYPSDDQFVHELSYTNNSYNSDEQNQHSDPRLPHYSSNDAEDHPNESRYYSNRPTYLEGNSNINNNPTATAQNYTVYGERNNLGVPASVDQIQGRQERRQEVAEIGALRAYHRALKEDKLKLMKATKESTEDVTTGVEPVVVTFVDKKSGIEYDAFGQIISLAPADARKQSRDSDDAILPHADQLPEGMSVSSPYGQYCPPSNNPQFNLQSLSIAQHNDQQHPSQPVYGYDYPPAHLTQYDIPPQYPGQAYPEWQGGTFYPPGTHMTSLQNVYDQPVTPVPKIPNYLACSIMVFLCFSWPFGLVAIRRAIAATEAKNRGSYVEAMELANSSRTWNIWGVIFGCVCYAILGVSLYYRVKNYNST